MRPDGPIPARLMIVGEAPGEEEVRRGVPFVGPSGMELNRMLGEVQILRSECLLTNVCRIRPPDNDITAFIPKAKKDILPNYVPYRNKLVHPAIQAGAALLEKEIQMASPNCILALGNTALWVLTGNWGIGHWRGSTLRHAGGAVVVPAFHPALILRQWDYRAITLADFRRASNFLNSRELPEPEWEFRIRPSFEGVLDTLRFLFERCEREPTWLEIDIETRFNHISCFGIGWSLLEAISIPIQEGLTHYWDEEQEAKIVWEIRRLLLHPNARIRGQNLLFDFQYIYREWHFLPQLGQDTMISHHTAYSGLLKRLDFQASLYCKHYVQWKPEKSAWKEGG